MTISTASLRRLRESRSSCGSAQRRAPRSLRFAPLTLARVVPLLLCCLLLTSACSGLDVGNANTGKVTFGLSVGSTRATDQTGRDFDITAASATIGEIRLYMPDGVSCNDVDDCEGDHIRKRGPWVVNLVDDAPGIVLPAEVRVPVGTYRRVEIRFDDANDVTLSASGRVLVDGTPTSFSLSLDFNEDVRFEGSVVVTENNLSNVLMALEPLDWFADLPLGQCADDGDLPIEGGTLIVEDGDGACADIEGTIKDAIKASGAF